MSPLPPAGTLPNAYLHAGHLFVSATPCRVSTDPRILRRGRRSSIRVAGVGGLNHFLLPQGPENTAPSARFGNIGRAVS